MTYAEREAIMSKDIITTAELARLLGTNESQASRTLQQIKAALKKKGSLRVDARGKLHTQDYCDHYNIGRR